MVAIILWAAHHGALSAGSSHFAHSYERAASRFLTQEVFS